MCEEEPLQNSCPEGTKASRFQSASKQATISATSYVREGVQDRARRPVMVFFNGGPGASSSPLHFGAFGPRKRAVGGPAAGASTEMLDNPASPIDGADLLFVGRGGTGFSR